MSGKKINEHIITVEEKDSQKNSKILIPISHKINENADGEYLKSLSNK